MIGGFTNCEDGLHAMQLHISGVLLLIYLSKRQNIALPSCSPMMLQPQPAGGVCPYLLLQLFHIDFRFLHLFFGKLAQS